MHGENVVQGKKTVVVVDDDDDMRHVITRALLADTRIDVIASVPDARSAVDEIRRSTPDAVVLDHYIDGTVMGLDSAPVIKTVSPNTKVAVFTEKDLDLEAYLEPEVDGYLRKENLSELLPLMRRLLGLGTTAAGDKTEVI